METNHLILISGFCPGRRGGHCLVLDSIHQTVRPHGRPEGGPTIKHASWNPVTVPRRAVCAQTRVLQVAGGLSPDDAVARSVHHEAGRLKNSDNSQCTVTGKLSTFPPAGRSGLKLSRLQRQAAAIQVLGNSRTPRRPQAVWQQSLSHRIIQCCCNTVDIINSRVGTMSLGRCHVA